MVLGVLTQATAGEGFPEDTLVGTSVPVDVSLDPGVTGRGQRRVARLQGQGVNEEVKIDGVSCGASELMTRYWLVDDYVVCIEIPYVGSV